MLLAGEPTPSSTDTTIEELDARVKRLVEEIEELKKQRREEETLREEQGQQVSELATRVQGISSFWGNNPIDGAFEFIRTGPLSSVTTPVA